MTKKEKDKTLSDFNEEGDLDKIGRNLEEQGLVKINPENSGEARLTPKGIEEVMRWKGKNQEMDFLLFLFRETGKRIPELKRFFE